MQTSTPFDNHSTFLYKQASLLQVPKKYVIVEAATEGRDPEDFRFWETDTIINYVARQESTSIYESWRASRRFLVPAEIRVTEFILIWKAVHQQDDTSTEIVDAIDAFIDRMGVNRQEVLDLISTWSTTVQEVKASDEATTNLIIQTQEELSKLPNLPGSNLQITSARVETVLASPTPYHTPLPDFFNQAQLTSSVPFISYRGGSVPGFSRVSVANDDDNFWFKIASGVTDRAVVLDSLSMTQNEAIYLTVWKGEDTLLSPNDMDEMDIVRATIALEEVQSSESSGTNYQIRISYEINLAYREGKDVSLRVWNRILEAVPSLRSCKVLSSSANKIVGEFFIHGLTIYPQLFLYLYLNEPLLQQYLYVEEKSRAIASIDRFLLSFRSVPSSTATGFHPRTIEASLLQEVFIPGRKFLINDELTSLNEELKTLHVRISNATTVDDAESFLHVLNRFFSLYLNRIDEITAKILRFVPNYIDSMTKREFRKAAGAVKEQDVPPTIDPETGNYLIDLEGVKLAERLRAYAPDMYISNMARKCQKKQQPLIINVDDIEYWQIELVGTEARQTLSYPKAGNTDTSCSDPDRCYHFVCPTDTYPYPGIKPNNMANKAQYPGIVCCYKTNHRLRSGSNLMKFFRGEPLQEEKLPTAEQALYIITTDKTVTDRIGTLSVLLHQFFRPIFGETTYRYMPFVHEDSVLYALLEALEPAEYMEVRTRTADREKYVNSIRRELASLPLEYYIQETDIPFPVQGFVDPVLYTPLLEKFFNVRIYLMNYQEINPRTGAVQSNLQVPAFTQFRSDNYFDVDTNPRAERTIILLRNWGSESNNLENPQCELIVTGTGADDRDLQTRIFGRDVARYLERAYRYMARTYSWDRQPDNTLIMRVNEFSSYNFFDIFQQNGNQIIGQGIDKLGKVQLIVVITPTRKQIVFGVPPSEPLIPYVSEGINRGSIPILTEMPNVQTTFAEAIRLFSQQTPSAITVNEDGLVDTVWFNLGDIQSAIYVHVVPEDPKRIRPLPPMLQGERFAFRLPSPNNRNILEEYRLKKKTAELIQQLIEYLFAIDSLKERIPYVRRWLRQRTRIVSEDRVDAIVWNPLLIPRILPVAETSLEVLNMLPNEGYLLDHVIHITSSAFESLAYSLATLSESIIGLSNEDLLDVVRIKQEVKDYYQYLTDFKLGEDILITSRSKYIQWTETRLDQRASLAGRMQYLTKQINYVIPVEAYNLQEPYVYQDSGSTLIHSSLNPAADRFYLIQNVPVGNNSLYWALNVAHTWIRRRTNIGHARSSQTTEKILYAYRLYTISRTGTLELIDNNAGNATESLQLLVYPGQANSYAALLPL